MASPPSSTRSWDSWEEAAGRPPAGPSFDGDPGVGGAARLEGGVRVSPTSGLQNAPRGGPADRPILDEGLEAAEQQPVILLTLHSATPWNPI